MAKYYPNRITGKVAVASEFWGRSKRELEDKGYITDFFKPHQYNGQDFYVLRKKQGNEYIFEKVSKNGTKYKLPYLLEQGWEIVQEPIIAGRD